MHIAAATIASDVTWKIPSAAAESGVVCLMDMGQTAAFMKAYPVLPPRQSSPKISFEKYSLHKMEHGLSNWP